MARCSHPFVIDIRPLRHMRGRFAYWVGRPGETKVYSLQTYATFEEARRAGKAALEAAVAEWSCCEPGSRAGELTS